MLFLTFLQQLFLPRIKLTKTSKKVHCRLSLREILVLHAYIERGKGSKLGGGRQVSAIYLSENHIRTKSNMFGEGGVKQTGLKHVVGASNMKFHGFQREFFPDDFSEEASGRNSRMSDEERERELGIVQDPDLLAMDSSTGVSYLQNPIRH